MAVETIQLEMDTNGRDDVRDLTGAHITMLRRLDSNGEAFDAQAVAEAVRQEPAESVLVVPGAGGAIQVIPYQR